MVCHPLDTIKTVAFVDTSRRNSLRHVVGVIFRREGLRGFYRGAGITIVGSAPGVAAYLSSYEFCNNKMKQSAFVPAPVGHLVSGFFAEAVSCVFWVPIDVIKERLQSQGPQVKGRYRSSLDGLRVCVANESVRGLYKGYLATLASFGPFSAIYFGAYEQMKVVLEPLQLSPSATAFCASGTANALACLLANPLELVKTRMQVQRSVLTVDGAKVVTALAQYQYKGLWDGLVAIGKEEGIRGLCRGVSMRMLYAVPNMALTMFCYEELKRRLV